MLILEKVKGLLQLEKVMIHAKTCYFLKFINNTNVIISIYLLCVGGLSLIISDQEDKKAFGKF